MRDAPPFEVETRARHRDGHQIDVHLSLAPMRTRGGQLRGACAVIRDITDRKYRRRLLASQLTRLRELTAESAEPTELGPTPRLAFPEKPETELAAAIERTLRVAREQLGMDVAWVGEFSEQSLVIRGIDGEHDYFGIKPGEAIPLKETYCLRMVSERAQN